MGRILDSINLTIYKGERVLLLGENGCGKTTLLRLLATMVYPSEGVFEQNIMEQGQVFADTEWFRKVGYVFQNPTYQLFMPSVQEEVGFRSPSEAHTADVLQRFSMQDIELRHPQSLSQGQKRRVSVAGITAGGPQALLLDEPTVGQDFDNLKRLVGILDAMQQEQEMTMVTVTHDYRCAAVFADRVVWMKDGRIYQIGGPELVETYFKERNRPRRLEEKNVRRQKKLDELQAKQKRYPNLNSRLLQMVPESVKYIAGSVLSQWIALLCNMAVIFSVSFAIASAVSGTAADYKIPAIIFAVALLVRQCAIRIQTRMQFLATTQVKGILRRQFYQKLLSMGEGYKEKMSTGEVVQIMGEGVEQLETYFGQYLPQLVYAIAAPLTLFAVIATFSPRTAIVLFAFVPLIPVSIMLIQKLARRLLAKYWKRYTDLGDVFLENTQGLTTLKIYQADAYKQRQMEEKSELFRKATMKVLSMQLNSVTMMDIIAFGGAAVGVILAVTQAASGQLALFYALAIILLSSEFFIPMRILGSFFHIAMNGMAAARKMFRILDTPVEDPGEEVLERVPQTICFENVNFSYTLDRPILKDLTFQAAPGSFIAIAGVSGSGKSTIAGLLTARNKMYEGSITIGKQQLKDIHEANLHTYISLLRDKSYLFTGTVRENLLMADPNATDTQMWEALEQSRIADFLRGEAGLETVLTEQGMNLSGGQRQRIALARALLQDAPVYIFDEATSNIDVESEESILQVMQELAQKKTVIMVSHRLANTVHADKILVLEQGVLAETGTHKELMACKGVYAAMYTAQKKLESYTQEVTEHA